MKEFWRYNLSFNSCNHFNVLTQVIKS